VDFALADEDGTIGLEVKIGGAVMSVLRQLARYAESPKLSSLMLVTTRPQHKIMPCHLQGKPLLVVMLDGLL